MGKAFKILTLVLCLTMSSEFNLRAESGVAPATLLVGKTSVLLGASVAFTASALAFAKSSAGAWCVGTTISAATFLYLDGGNYRKAFKSFLTELLRSAVVYPMVFTVQSRVRHWFLSYQGGTNVDYSPYHPKLVDGYQRLQAAMNLQAQNYRDDIGDCLAMLDRLLSPIGQHLKAGDKMRGVAGLAMAIQRMATLYWEINPEDMLIINAFETYLPETVEGSTRSELLNDAIEKLSQDDSYFKEHESYYQKILGAISEKDI